MGAVTKLKGFFGRGKGTASGVAVGEQINYTRGIIGPEGKRNAPFRGDDKRTFSQPLVPPERVGDEDNGQRAATGSDEHHVKPGDEVRPGPSSRDTQDLALFTPPKGGVTASKRPGTWGPQPQSGFKAGNDGRTQEAWEPHVRKSAEDHPALFAGVWQGDRSLDEQSDPRGECRAAFAKLSDLLPGLAAAKDKANVLQEKRKELTDTLKFLTTAVRGASRFAGLAPPPWNAAAGPILEIIGSAFAAAAAHGQNVEACRKLAMKSWWLLTLIVKHQEGLVDKVVGINTYLSTEIETCMAAIKGTTTEYIARRAMGRLERAAAHIASPGIPLVGGDSYHSLFKDHSSALDVLLSKVQFQAILIMSTAAQQTTVVAAVEAQPSKHADKPDAARQSFMVAVPEPKDLAAAVDRWRRVSGLPPPSIQMEIEARRPDGV